MLGSISGGSSSTVWESMQKIFTLPGLLLIVCINLSFAAGIFYGFGVSANALPIAVAIGAVVAFMYSAIILGVDVTVTKFLGILCVLLGVYLLR